MIGEDKTEYRKYEFQVWRVLLELLSCHAVGSPAATPASLSTDPNSCYKSVDTPSGPRLVISVSKTYIRLKELILEKKHLEKEMNRMKQLNTHLESKLGEQVRKTLSSRRRITLFYRCKSVIQSFMFFINLRNK